MSRKLPWLDELQPEMFAEIDPELAARARDRGRRLDDDRDRARRDRGAREGDRAHAAAAGRRAGRSTRSRCRGTGASAAPTPGDAANDLGALVRRPERVDPGGQGVRLRRARRAGDASGTTDAWPACARRAPRRRARPRPPRRRPRPDAVTEIAIHRAGAPERMGFFTDTTVCIGCKACEVACKQWNDLPADGGEFRKGGSYDHTGELRRDDVAPRALRRAAPTPAAGATRATSCRTSSPPAESRRRRQPSTSADVGMTLGLHVRRLQALHERRLPRRLPDRRADPHRVRDRGAAARRLQRLRLLHPGVPVRRRRPRPRRRPRRQVHALLRPPRGRARARVREGVPDRLDPVRPLRRARRRRRSGGSRRCTSAASRAPTSTAPATSPSEQLAGGLGAFFLLTEPPERYGLPAQADSPIQENVVPATRPRSAPGCWPRPASRPRSLRPRAGARRRGEPLWRARLARPAATRERGDGPRARRRARHRRRRSARPAGPASWRARRRGRDGRARTAPQWEDARWSYLYERRHAPTRARRRRDREAVARGRARRARRRAAGDRSRARSSSRRCGRGRCRSTSGSAGSRRARRSSALACDLAGDERSARGRAQGRARRARARRPPLLILDLGRPERFYNMLRDLQAALADVDGRVGADGVRQRSPRRAVGADLLGPRPRGARARRRQRGRRRLPRLLHRRAARLDRRAGVGAQSRSSSARSSSRTATATGAAATRLVLVADRAAARPPDARARSARRDRRDGRRARRSRRSTSAASGALADGPARGPAGALFSAAQVARPRRAGARACAARCAPRPSRARHVGSACLPGRRPVLPLRVGRARGRRRRATTRPSR